ncbi:Origin recognition complex, subunit 1, partial [Coemansia furcata]
ATKQTKRKQHISHDSDDEVEDVVEWGQRLDGQNALAGPAANATPSARRVTRQSGMTNKDLYRSVIVNGTEYYLGQAVQVQSSNDTPYLAIIHKLWESERGEKQMVARWLLRQSEMFVSKKVGEVHAEPGEVFYSNADDLVTPDQILAPLDVLSHTAYQTACVAATSLSPPRKKATTKVPELPSVYFCRRYFNEQSAFIGDLDWDDFYRGSAGKILDPVIDAAMFKKQEKKKPLGKEAAAQAGRARVQAKRGRQPAALAATPRATRKRKADDSDDEDADPNGAPTSDDDDEDSKSSVADRDDFTPAKRGRRKSMAAAPRTPARARRATLAKGALTPATTATKRRMRLQDIQLSAAVSATILRRATRMGSELQPVASEGATVYEVARQRLHVSAVPDTLPCREDEFAEIYGHLYNTIEERNSMCMYISGVPGTGKTATVHEVIRTLQENAEEGELPDFQYIELNGMKMTEPAQAYTQLWQAIAGEKVTPKHAAQLLEKHFSTPSPRRRTYVVLMDELDLLVTKS